MRAATDGRRRLFAPRPTLFLILLAATPVATAAQDVGLPIGSIPGAASVEDLDGATVDLAQYIGNKPVVVEFWATWCPLCRALEPTLQTVKERYGDRIEILIIGVAVNQSPRQIRRHLAGHPMPGRVLYDAKGAAVRAFQAPTTSYIAILDAQGKVRYTGVGEDQPLLDALERIVGAAASGPDASGEAR